MAGSWWALADKIQTLVIFIIMMSGFFVILMVSKSDDRNLVFALWGASFTVTIFSKNSLVPSRLGEQSRWICTLCLPYQLLSRISIKSKRLLNKFISGLPYAFSIGFFVTSMLYPKISLASAGDCLAIWAGAGLFLFPLSDEFNFMNVYKSEFLPDQVLIASIIALIGGSCCCLTLSGRFALSNLAFILISAGGAYVNQIRHHVDRASFPQSAIIVSQTIRCQFCSERDQRQLDVLNCGYMAEKEIRIFLERGYFVCRSCARKDAYLLATLGATTRNANVKKIEEVTKRLRTFLIYKGFLGPGKPSVQVNWMAHVQDDRTEVNKFYIVPVSIHLNSADVRNGDVVFSPNLIDWSEQKSKEEVHEALLSQYKTLVLHQQQNHEQLHLTTEQQKILTDQVNLLEKQRALLVAEKTDIGDLVGEQQSAMQMLYDNHKGEKDGLLEQLQTLTQQQQERELAKLREGQLKVEQEKLKQQQEAKEELLVKHQGEENELLVDQRNHLTNLEESLSQPQKNQLTEQLALQRNILTQQEKLLENPIVELHELYKVVQEQEGRLPPIHPPV